MSGYTSQVHFSSVGIHMQAQFCSGSDSDGIMNRTLCCLSETSRSFFDCLNAYRWFLAASHEHSAWDQVKPAVPGLLIIANNADSADQIMPSETSD